MNKKIIWGIVALIIAILIIALLLFLPKQNTEKVLLKDGMTLSQEKCSKLKEVTVIHAAGCGACAIAIPRLQELEQELEREWDYYDLAIDSDKEKVLKLGLIPEAVPTIIINCKVYVGVKDKKEYKEAVLG